MCPLAGKSPRVVPEGAQQKEVNRSEKNSKCDRDYTSPGPRSSVAGSARPLEIAAGIRLLRSMQRSARSHSENYPLERLSELRTFVTAVDGHLEQSRLGKKSHRRNSARATFLDRLADLFENYLGLQSTFTWTNYPDEEEEESGERGGEASGPSFYSSRRSFISSNPRPCTGSAGGGWFATAS